MEETQQVAASPPSTSQDCYHISSPPIRSKMLSFPDSEGKEEDSIPLKGGGLRRGRVAAINETSEKMVLLDISSHTTSSSNYPALSRFQTQQRIVSRENGHTNIQHNGVTKNWTGFITDFFTTIINTRWYIIILIFCLSYLISWVFFGAIWKMVAWLEGTSNVTCLNNVDSFSSALLFSIQTQVTIGYGNSYVTNGCIMGLLMLVLQSASGLIMDGILLGLLFTKITHPQNRRKTIVFSERAVMCLDGDVRYLEFRIGDLRKSQIAECHIQLILYWYRNLGMDRYSFEQHDLKCNYDNGTDKVILLTPVTIRHKIDQSSPLWTESSLSISRQELEVVVVLEGVVEATGLTLQALWSYTAEEIVVGEKLQPIVHRENGQWVVDFHKFNEVINRPQLTYGLYK